MTPRAPRISHSSILEHSRCHDELIDVYRTAVLSQRTRTIRLLGRKNPARIIHTLLGYEVQASYKRIQCPDMPTARYIRLFSELGCHTIRLPYDPTITEQLIPRFESTIEAVAGKIEQLLPTDEKMRRYALRKAYETIRRRLADAV